jgi:hypothetical protein
MSSYSKKQKITVIERELQTIFFFSAQEIEQYIQKIREFPEQGLDMFLAFLQEAKQQQNNFFAETIKTDPEFVKAFSRFLNQTTLHIEQQFEEKEQGKAENILKDI